MNYKRHKPRRQVRCPVCTDHRDGNAGQAATVEPEEAPPSFGPAKRKKHRVDKPWELWVKYGGKTTWLLGKKWFRWGRYAKRSGAEQARTAFLRDRWSIKITRQAEVRRVA